MSKQKTGYTKEVIEMMQLAKSEDNNKCAECEAPCPLWVSYTLGVFICTRCAGLHRSLGVHLSRVKSITLDSWTPEIVESMKKKGNKVAKSYFESTLPSNYPRPRDERSLIEFIRNKYDYRSYSIKQCSYEDFVKNLTKPETVTKEPPKVEVNIPPASPKKDDLEEIFSNPIMTNVTQPSSQFVEPSKPDNDLSDLFSMPSSATPVNFQQPSYSNFGATFPPGMNQSYGNQANFMGNVPPQNFSSYNPGFSGSFNQPQSNSMFTSPQFGNNPQFNQSPTQSNFVNQSNQFDIFSSEINAAKQPESDPFAELAKSQFPK